MSSSKLIAGLIGPLILAIGAALLLNSGMFTAMVSQLAQNYGVVFLAGVMGLVGGLAILRFHNIWSADWRVLITIFGWLSVIGGLGRMLMPNEAATIAQSIVNVLFRGPSLGARSVPDVQGLREQGLNLLDLPMRSVALEKLMEASETSIYLAKLMGPIYLVVAIGMLLNRDYFRTMAKEVAASPALFYLTGVLALVVGGLIVLLHNVWSGRPIVITLVGWAAIAKGVVRTVLPTRAASWVAKITDNANALMAAVSSCSRSAPFSPRWAMGSGVEPPQQEVLA